MIFSNDIKSFIYLSVLVIIIMPTGICSPLENIEKPREKQGGIEHIAKEKPIGSLTNIEIRQLLNKYKIDDEKVQSYYQRHPELFSERFMFTFQELTIIGDKNKSSETLGQYRKSNKFKGLVDWLDKQNIQYRPSITDIYSEDIPKDILLALYKMLPGQTIDVLREGKLSFIQLLKKKPRPKSLAESTSIIKLHLLNVARNKSI
ncbi:peptidyl-prolyl cis-trans isomerase [Colwelliaceae bacterium 6441]